MPAYFTSDVHLRLDRPERGHAAARWVESLGNDDSLTIVGDLCDFWFASRRVQTGVTACPGLKSLADFRALGSSSPSCPGTMTGRSARSS